MSVADVALGLPSLASLASLADWFEPWQAPIMQRAFLAGLLVSVVAGVVGALVVVNRMVFIGGAVAHTAFGGVGLAYFLGLPPMVGALGFSTAASIGMGLVQHVARERADTLIGALWAIGMAVGLLLIQATPGATADPMSYLFGTIVMVPTDRLWTIAAVDVAVLLLFVGLYKEWLAISFDATFASVRNVPRLPLYLVQLAMISAAVVVLMEMVGLILVLALLTLPVATANLWLRDLRWVVAASIGLAAAVNTLGLWLAYMWNTLAGPTIVLFAAATYVAAFLLRGLLRRRGPGLHGRMRTAQ